MLTHAAEASGGGSLPSPSYDFRDQVAFNAVCPGVIHTPMAADMLEKQADAMTEIMRDQPIGRMGRAAEIAAAVLWLCSPGASLVIGVALPVDGGFTAH